MHDNCKNCKYLENCQKNAGVPMEIAPSIMEGIATHKTPEELWEVMGADFRRRGVREQQFLEIYAYLSQFYMFCPYNCHS